MPVVVYAAWSVVIACKDGKDGLAGHCQCEVVQFVGNHRRCRMLSVQCHEQFRGGVTKAPPVNFSVRETFQLYLVNPVHIYVISAKLRQHLLSMNIISNSSQRFDAIESCEINRTDEILNHPTLTRTCTIHPVVIALTPASRIQISLSSLPFWGEISHEFLKFYPDKSTIKNT